MRGGAPAALLFSLAAPRAASAALRGARRPARRPAGAPLDSFLPPVSGKHANGTWLTPTLRVADAGECADRCLQLAEEVVSMNVCGGTQLTCHCSGWGVEYELLDQADCKWYRRSLPRNDSRALPQIPIQAEEPLRGVALAQTSLLSKAFAANIEYLHLRANVDAMLYRFRKRKDAPCYQENPRGYCYGWDCSLAPDYAASSFIMGAAASLRWMEDAGLKDTLETLLTEMSSCSNDDGWFLPWSKSEMAANWYTTSGMNVITEALIEADGVVSHDVLKMLRQAHDVYVNHTLLPVNLPANGGPDPVHPYAAGFNNETSCGHGTDKHNIYFQYTSLHHNGATARSSVGTHADIELMENLYIEDWWVRALAARDEWHGIWHRNFFTHNYEVRGLTGLVDLYVMTGNRTYLDAALGGWAMLRESFLHVGGSLAINEGTYFPPKSYYLSYTDLGSGKLEPPPNDTRRGGDLLLSRDGAFRAERDVFCSNAPKATAVATPTADACAALVPTDAFGFQWDCNGHSAKSCIVISSADQCRTLEASGCNSTVFINETLPVPPHGSKPWPEGHKPTGELCGSAFFVQLNTKFHALFPDNDTFAAEIERTVLNVALASIDGEHNGQEPVGIRYFQNMHKQKQLPRRDACCCENHGTHLLGAIPQHIFSTPPAVGGSVTAARINLYTTAALSITAPGADGSLSNTSVSVDTQWPLQPGVQVAVTTQNELVSFDLVVRIPTWVHPSVSSVSITVNGTEWKQRGQPGSYVHVALKPWPAGVTTVEFALPMSVQAHRYVGADQLPPFVRHAYTVGPILLAATGTWKGTMDNLHIPGVDGSKPQEWMVGTDSLHFTVKGQQEVTFKPYFEIGSRVPEFATYPAFDA